ncbi:MAG: IS30 family transposase [bacterium]|jgi:IS30 family transposase
MWDRWQKGDPLQTIAQLFGRNHSSAACIFSIAGGIRPSNRKRSTAALSLSEREDISRGLAAEISLRLIAVNLNRNPSTISREVNRNGGRANYRAAAVDQAGWLKRTYPDDERFQVSHETIYRSLYIKARGALKKELTQHLRRTRVMRRSHHHTQKTSDHGQIFNTVSISERPASAGDRGKEVQTKARMVCCDSTCRKGLICPLTLKLNSTALQDN